MDDTKRSGMFDGIWWTVNMPPDWTAQGEETCATFRRTNSPGVLQISAAQKEIGPVTDDELREFAIDEIPAGEQLSKITYNYFSGFSATFKKDNVLWREWWLKAGNLMIYATYNISSSSTDDRSDEQRQVGRILESLKPKETM